MFDVGFSELFLIGLVSLLVIGPERLPKVARIAGYWLGKTRSMVASVKEEITLELQAEELRQIFKEQSGLQDVQQMIDETSNTLHSTIESLQSTARAEEHELEQHRELLPTDSAEPHEPK
jgi:sec-independent protein translocase protein TatB